MKTRSAAAAAAAGCLFAVLLLSRCAAKEAPVPESCSSCSVSSGAAETEEAPEASPPARTREDGTAAGSLFPHSSEETAEAGEDPGGGLLRPETGEETGTFSGGEENPGRNEQHSAAEKRPAAETGRSGEKGAGPTKSVPQPSRPETRPSEDSRKTTAAPPPETEEETEPHVHTWIDVTETVHHPAREEEGHWETVIVRPAWEERGEARACGVRCGCGLEFSSREEWETHSASYLRIGTEEEKALHGHFETIYTYEIIRHEAETREEWVVDVPACPAWDETVVTGQMCPVCGAFREK